MSLILDGVIVGTECLASCEYCESVGSYPLYATIYKETHNPGFPFRVCPDCVKNEERACGLS